MLQSIMNDTFIKVDVERIPVKKSFVCAGCGRAVDRDGYSIDPHHCDECSNYSHDEPECEVCGYFPCDQSC